MTAPASRYRAEIDGLRAVAVTAVVLFHLGYDWIPGGFVGVDVFFVISGFLITGIIIDELQAGTFSFREFWTRRILRIFPALLVTIAATVAAAWILLPRTDHPDVGSQAVAALGSVANIWFWRHAGDYWGPAAEASPLLHTWSLSVEEQFYLCLPPLLWLVASRAALLLKPLLIAGTLASFGLFLLGVQRYGIESMFYPLPSRAWELGVGCTLAAYARNVEGGNRNAVVAALCRLLGAAGLALILAACLLTPGRTRAVVGGVVGAALVLAHGRSGVCHTLLTQRPIVSLGKISYSVYLWHWPLIVFSEFCEKAVGVAIARSLLLVPILALATGSYLFIEQTTRRNHHILPWIAAAAAATLGLAGALAMSSGRYDTSGFERPTSASHLYHLGRSSVIEVSKSTIANPAVNSQLSDAYLNGGIIVGADHTPRIVVLGDSHGTMWCDTIRKVVETLGITTSFYCANGTSPFIKEPIEYPRFFTIAEKRAFDEARLEHIARWRPDVVIICARWAAYSEGSAEPLLEFLDTHAGHVLLVEQTPELDVGDREVVQWLCYKQVKPENGLRYALPAGNTTKYEHSRRMVRALAHSHRNCDVVPMRDIYADGPRVWVLDGRNVIYGDNDHLTDYGTSLGAGRIEAAIRRALAAEDVQ